MEDDPILESKHKIFLSHSGAQKEFVEHLCQALEKRYYYPFFDRRPESLPQGENFVALILNAAKQCQMAVVVVSEEYFMSKWPMIELHAFVQAIKTKTNTKLKILPLFYGLSVHDLDDKTRQKRWIKKWKIFAKDDVKGRIKVNEWKDALNELRQFNGLPYDMILKPIVAYENEIVSQICNSISPNIKWDDLQVQGKSNICKVVSEKIEQIGPSHKYEVKVVGIYGVGGIGKTTTCKTLCNEFSRKFEGRVCHVEFESENSTLEKLLQKVLIDLTRKNPEVDQLLNDGEVVDLASGTISMHDLYREFAELEAKGELDEETEMEKRRWVYVDKSDLRELESAPPGGGCWHRLVRLHIGCDANKIESLEGIEWHCFANVVVLKLHGLNNVGGVLSLERLKCLRSLELYNIVNLHRLEGLEGLRHLTYFRWSSTWPHGVMRTQIVGQFPPSLKFLEINCGMTLLGPGVLTRCSHLCKLILWGIEANNLDLSNCWCLQSVMLHDVGKFRTLLGLTASWASRLESLQVECCDDLVNIPGLHHLVGLERLVLWKLCKFKELSDLQGLTKLQVLNLFVYGSKVRLGVLAGPWIPRQLWEFHYNGWIEVPNLDGFEQLQVLNLSSSYELTCMGGAWDLSALQCLNLRHCKKLLQLPDLSKSRNLEELDLRDCEKLELCEEGIHMLAELPRLQPVLVGGKLRLDLVRWKVLRYLSGYCPASWLAWKEGDWEESDLGIPPVKVGRFFLRPGAGHRVIESVH